MGVQIADAGIMLHDLPHSFHNIGLHPVPCGKHFHPAGHIKFHSCKGKFIQHILKDLIDVFFLQLLTVDRLYGNAVFIFHLFGKLPCFFTVRLCGIEQNHKRLF